MVAPIPLEDTVADILGKAQRGLSLSDEALANRAGVPVGSIASLKKGALVEKDLFKIATTLGLGAQALSDLASGHYLPEPITPPEGLACFNTTFHDIMVNSYLVWDPLTREAAFFDTGADGDPMLEFAAAQDLRVNQLFITHVHGDHVYDLDRLVEKTGARARVCKRELIEGAEPFSPGDTFAIGNLTVETRRTSGHAVGGITYVVKGLSRLLALVGDAMFAGSMGGGVVSYAEALQTNREEILTLPDETILCPGHGPLTTVGEQKRANPFFAA
jgi:glyoxylase-like metal-dependent hydrolase (beta-lactamase superfamily II)